MSALPHTRPIQPTDKQVGADSRAEARAEMTHVGDHAVVLGASVAGLAAAAALAKRFDRVTIVERDTLPQPGECRRGIPQGRHVHILLPAGLVGLSDLLPGVVEDLRARGARVMDTTEVRFHIALAGACCWMTPTSSLLA